MFLLSLPMRGRGLKSTYICISICGKLSLPMRGAWIEILVRLISPLLLPVAPHTGSVD